MTPIELAKHYWEAIEASVDGWNRIKHPRTGELSNDIYHRGLREFGAETWENAVSATAGSDHD